MCASAYPGAGSSSSSTAPNPSLAAAVGQSYPLSGSPMPPQGPQATQGSPAPPPPPQGATPASTSAPDSLTTQGTPLPATPAKEPESQGEAHRALVWWFQLKKNVIVFYGK